MGYCVYSHEGQFRILRAYEAEALEALRSMGDLVTGETLVKAIESVGWDVYTAVDEPDEEGLEAYAITHISHSDKWHDDDEQMLHLLAPFVEPGSFLELEGEDGDRWRIWFNGQESVEDYPEIIWHPPEHQEQRPPRTPELADQMRRMFEK